ncbi:MAG: hypothetical protein JXR59_04500 [Desulfuromonadaceae bacterium]|nr:hypothetical protein [Desulfuromonadaceae bacterium]
MFRKTMFPVIVSLFISVQAFALEWDPAWYEIINPTPYTVATLPQIDQVTQLENAWAIANYAEYYDVESFYINGHKLSEFELEDENSGNSTFYYFVDEKLVATLTAGQDALYMDNPNQENNPWTELSELIKLINALNISYLSSTVSGVGGGNEISAYTSAAGVIGRIVFSNLVLPGASSRAEKQQDESRHETNKPRSFGAALAWEDVDLYNRENGDLYVATVGMAWDTDHFSYGFMLPYDYIAFDRFDAHRISLIGFGQYHQNLSESLCATFTGHLNYTYSDMDFDYIGDSEVNLFGGGFSATVTLDQDLIVASAGASLFYNKDDTDVDDDEQYLVKFGTNLGLRNGDNGVINLFGIWNVDITNYDHDPGDDNYFELGLEGSYTFTDTFEMTLGYKKVVDLDDFQSDQIHLGGLWKF